jgi:uncharacterized membrane protein YgdD (TMEM256/DUF423 family)
VRHIKRALEVLLIIALATLLAVSLTAMAIIIAVWAWLAPSPLVFVAGLVILLGSLYFRPIDFET